MAYKAYLKEGKAGLGGTIWVSNSIQEASL
jgi:hypothetical protein